MNVGTIIACPICGSSRTPAVKACRKCGSKAEPAGAKKDPTHIHGRTASTYHVLDGRISTNSGFIESCMDDEAKERSVCVDIPSNDDCDRTEDCRYCTRIKECRRIKP